MKRTFFKILLLFAHLVSSAFIHANAQQKQLPNIILVYFDDMGFGDLSRTGAVGYNTPHMDKLSSEGMFFTQFYSPQAVCSASRAGLMTGCYPNRINMSGALDHTAKTGLNPEEETIPEVLKKKGYATGMFGKWHLGHLPEFLPPAQGFDEYYGIPYSHDMWPNHPVTKNYYPPLPLIEGTKTISTTPDPTQFTTSFTERSVSFIRKNKHKPFFLYLAHPLPHVPLFVSEKFKGKSQQGLYGDVMMELDWSIGQITKTLAELKLDKNTIIIITSDNGPWYNYGEHAGSNAGFREGKGGSWEGGQRVSCIISWKGVIPAGSIANRMASAIDILPTLAEITGAPLPKNKIDGVSLVPLLKGDMSKEPRKTFYYYYRRNSLEAVRHGNFKLVFPHPGRTYEGFSPGKDGQPGGANENFAFEGGLFDLRRDPGERYNVIKDYPEVAAQLMKLADEARDDLGDDLTNNPGKNRRPAGRTN
jgi:arylsulfatase A-like enzyme